MSKLQKKKLKKKIKKNMQVEGEKVMSAPN